jgi:hypothetical protein
MLRRRLRHFGIAIITGATLSCASTPSPTPTPSRTTAAGPGRGAGTAIVPISRDSIAALRAVYVTKVMQSIAGRENQPATQVFKNVQVLTNLTAGQLVEVMDKKYSAELSWNCVNCHRFAAQGDFASDTSANKKRARFMQQMVNDINTAELPKLYPQRTPSVSCGTCHRGYNEPPPPTYMVPERGKPGGPPLPTRRPG